MKKAIVILQILIVIVIFAACSPNKTTQSDSPSHPLMGRWKNSDGIMLIFHDDPVNDAFGGITEIIGNNSRVRDFDLVGDSQFKVIYPGHDDITFIIDYKIDGTTLTLTNLDEWLGETSSTFQKMAD